MLVTRKIVKDGSKYFGPYHSAYSVRETLDTLRKVIPLRTCSDAVLQQPLAPLPRVPDQALPRAVLPAGRPRRVRSASARGDAAARAASSVELIDQLRRRDGARPPRPSASRRRRALRDRLRAIETTQERQQAVSHGGGDQDIFGFYREGGFIEAQVLFVRQGKLTGNQAYQLEDFELPDEEVVRALLTQFYQGERYVPDEVLLPIELEDQAVRAEYLSERKGRRVEILCPQRGDRVRLLEMARENAAQSFRERQRRRAPVRAHQRGAAPQAAPAQRAEAHRVLRHLDLPGRHGGRFDGRPSTRAQPDKNGYRRFRIKTVAGQDDFGMMFEVLRRRFERAKRDGRVSRSAGRRRRQGAAQRRAGRCCASSRSTRSTPSAWPRCA